MRKEFLLPSPGPMDWRGGVEARNYNFIQLTEKMVD